MRTHPPAPRSDPQPAPRARLAARARLPARARLAARARRTPRGPADPRRGSRSLGSLVLGSLVLGSLVLGSLVLGLGLVAVGAARAEEGAAPPSLSERFRFVARLQVPVEEISGWTSLPAAPGAEGRSFLAVSDEGTYDASTRTVRGALHRLTFCAGDDGISLAHTEPVTLHLGARIPRLDPAWARGGSLLDLEACVPLPGTPDLYLLAGERNPEDATDGGANRLYVVRYPRLPSDGPASPEGADLLAYLRVPDLPDDTINDRFEGVVALGTSDVNVWQVYAFKERTQDADRPPVYFPLLLERATADGEGGAFTLSSPHLGQRHPSLPTLLPSRERLGAQSDAVVGPAGDVWVLDRWRREIHRAEAAPLPALELRFRETFDLYELIEAVPGERESSEPAAPGAAHAGYGRHEALAFDARGWLWLAADLGGGNESVVTVLAPRAPRPGGAD